MLRSALASVIAAGLGLSLAPVAPAALGTSTVAPLQASVATQRVLFDTLATTNYNTGQLRATGRISPTPPTGSVVYLQRWDGPARVWVTIGSGRTSGARITALANRPGSVASYRLVIPSRGSLRPGISPTRSLVHYVWRGAFVKPLRMVTAEGGAANLILETTDRSLRKATLNASNGRIAFVPDSTGCLSVATRSENDQNTASSRIMLGEPPHTIVRDERLEGAAVLLMNLDLRGRPGGVFLNAGKAVEGTNTGVKVTMALLCNN